MSQKTASNSQSTDKHLDFSPFMSQFFDAHLRGELGWVCFLKRDVNNCAEEDTSTHHAALAANC